MSARKRPAAAVLDPLVERAAAKARSRAEADAATGCLLWQGAKDRKGYGRLKVGGFLFSPHRVVLESRLGRRLHRWEDACHACDRPSCINPDHLFAGERADNVRDAVEKRRHRMPPRPFKKGDQGFVRAKGAA